MSSLSICTECLASLRIHSRAAERSIRSFPSFPSTTSISSQSFSTTAGAQKTEKQRGGRSAYRVSNSRRLYPKPRATPKLPPVGERKALRKRIVLSNTNALEVHGMRDLNLGNMADPAQVGRVLGLGSGQLLDQLRGVEAFKPTQNWNMFRRPGVLVRKETVDLGRTIVDIKAGNREGRPRTVRRIIAGDGGTGRSLMLLQAMSMAFLDEWIVINVPEGQDYTIANSAYEPMKSSSEQEQEQGQPLQNLSAQAAPVHKEPLEEMVYSQPKLTAALLERVTKSNEKVLKQQKLAQGYTVEGRNPKDLYSLAMIGCEDSRLSWSVWQALWKEFASPSEQKRPPVLLALDGIDNWMTLSHYRSAEFKLIHAFQLAPIRHFLDVIFDKDGAGKLASGGMILAATAGSNVPSVPAFNLLLRQLQAREEGLKPADEGFPMPEPYKAVDQRVLELLPGSEGLHVQRLKGLEKEVEARGLLRYFAQSGVMRELVNATTVAEKWSLAGGGVVGELARFGKRLRL